MEEFIDYAKVIMGTLGHKIFEPLVKATPAVEPASPSTGDTLKLHLERIIKAVGKVEADGGQTAEGFVVFKGSHISPVDDDTIPTVIKNRRKTVKVDENNILLEDELFTSPTYAAMFVIGKSENGLTRWKTSDGKSLKLLEAEQEME